MRFGTVEKQELQSRMRVTGTLKALTQTDIASAEAGVVTHVMVNEGDLIEQGQTLLQIDNRKMLAEKSRLESELALGKAKHELANAELKFAEEDLVAYKHSANQHAISKQRLRQSKTAVLTNQAKKIAAVEAIKGLQAQLRIIDVRLDDMLIKAPFDGQITARVAEVGQWLGVGDTAMVLTSQGKIEAWLDVPERFAHGINMLSDQISLNIGNKMLLGSNIKVLRNVDNRARTFKVVADVLQDELMPGMSVTAWLPKGDKSQYLTVPKDAIVSRNNRSFVYKINDKGITEAIAVSISFHQGNFAAVISTQLKSGDKVTTEGNERLMPGPVIAVVDEQQDTSLTQIL